ncbi:hypothetical protein RIF29_14893 [Crotalaria pallida]|uniref:Uncharacterized protein n=1 Tax=Crotalaria pallida TaxID=3830 RepID=A0AAN9FE88_CROPI
MGEGSTTYKGVTIHHPKRWHTVIGKGLCAVMWLWVFYKAKQDAPVVLGWRHPLEGHGYVNFILLIQVALFTIANSGLFNEFHIPKRANLTSTEFQYSWRFGNGMFITPCKEVIMFPPCKYKCPSCSSNKRARQSEFPSWTKLC